MTTFPSATALAVLVVLSGIAGVAVTALCIGAIGDREPPMIGGPARQGRR